jgi:hypothetical protein
VREREPETPEFGRRHPKPDIEDIAFEIGSLERLAPLEARGIGLRDERLREPAAQPKTLPLGSPDFVEGKPIEIVERDAACKTLAAPRRSR